jgi:hypothetical protein
MLERHCLGGLSGDIGRDVYPLMLQPVGGEPVVLVGPAFFHWLLARRPGGFPAQCRALAERVEP